MAAKDYEACETRVLAHEGGFTNDPRDPGGPTNWGITIKDARMYWEKDATAADVKAMPKSVAMDIYRKKYWAAQRCDDLPPGVDDSVFDYGVNSGIGRSGKVLRRVLGLPDDDWHTTDVVLAEVRKRDSRAIVIAINDERLRFLKSLSTWDHFGAGWGRRVAEVKAFSLQLASGGPPPSAPKVPTGGKGTHPSPSTGPVVVGGGAAAASSGGISHWVGAHPTITIALVCAIIIGMALLVQHLKNLHQTKQETPMPDTPVVPVLPSNLQPIKPTENPLHS